MSESTNNQQPSFAAEEKVVALIAENQLALTGYLRTLLRNPSDVNDVLQETNLVLWRKRAEYDPERPFINWACKFALNQSLACLKKKSRDKHQLLSEQVLETVARAALRRVEQIDTRMGALRDCLKQLSSEHQTILRKRYRDGVSVSELATEAGRSPNALSLMLYRIRNLLKECIERNLGGELA